MDLEVARAQMISQQLRTWEILDERVLGVMAQIPRERFLPPHLRDLAFADSSIPIGHGERMLPPKIQGRYLQAVAPGPDDTVFEVGTGTGFLTACLARLAGQVHSVDIEPEFTAAARERLAALEIENVKLETADAMAMPLPRRYDVIVVEGALPVYDKRFAEALAPGGRLVVVVGPPPVREVWRIIRHEDRSVSREILFETDIPDLRNAPQPGAFVF
jgi:protein-L-isoaspartate(D-aspartate) O-methyltransferase